MNGPAGTPAIPPGDALGGRIRDEIRAAGGAIPFARFMELALYAPGLGYYERGPGNIGRDGDFYTAVSVGPLFGELLAHLVATRLERVPGPLLLVEAGAHDGRLAADILAALPRYGAAFADRVEYRIVEPSGRRRAWQRDRLAAFGPRVEWSETFPPAVRGGILCNELLDALPAESWRWDAARRRWTEDGVAWDGNRFVTTPLATPPPAQWNLPPALAEVLPDGFRRERCPAAVSWWADAARALERGLLLTCDYGLAAEESLTPRHAGGTLRGYRRHRPAEDLLSEPGATDLTADVDFGALRVAGEAAGLATEYDGAQSGLLTRLLGETLNDAGRFGAWTPARAGAFRTLTHPQHMGRAFRSLVQARS